MAKRKVTIKLILGVLQITLSISAFVGAILLNLNLIAMQPALGSEGLNFYMSFLIILGFVLVFGGLFLMYDWWET